MSSWRDHSMIVLVTLLLLMTLTICIPISTTAHSVAIPSTEGFLFTSDDLPFTLNMTIRVGLVGFHSDSMPTATINTGSLTRSLLKTMEAYRPKNIDQGRELMAQYAFNYDVFHVDTTYLHRVEEFLASSFTPALDVYGNPLRLVDPSKQSQVSESQQQQQNVDVTSPFYTAAIPQIDIGLADILLDALADHLSLPKSDKKGGADKEYSIFLLNPSIERMVTNMRRLQRDHTHSTSSSGKPVVVEDKIVYGYINRTPQDVVFARSAGLTSGAFTNFAYINNWVGHGRWIIADVKSLASVNTNLDVGEGYMEEILATIYRTLYEGTNNGVGAANGGVTGSRGGYSEELLNVGLLGKRAKDQKALSNELTIYKRIRQAGTVMEVLRSNTIVPSLLDPSSLSSLSIASTHQRKTRNTRGSNNITQDTMAITVTPMLASYVASAVRGIVTTDMSTPPPLASVTSIPVLIFADHSHHIEPRDILDIDAIQKLVNKVTITGQVKITPIVHNIHSYPSVSSALYGSILPLYVDREDTARGARFIVNGDNLTLALYKASLTNPLLASVIPSQQSSLSSSSLLGDVDLTLEDIVEDNYHSLRLSNVDLSEIGGGNSNIFKAKSDQSSTPIEKQSQQATTPPSQKNSAFRNFHPYTLPVVVLSLTSLPQPATVAYPQTQGKKNSLITVLHQINKHTQTTQVGRDMLKKQLTIHVISALLQKLTGVIPPHIRYEFAADPPQPGLFTIGASSSSLALSSSQSSPSRWLGGIDAQPSTASALTHAGSPLIEYIDSTFSMGLHPFSPYSTLYKVTKIYRDNSRRNALLHFIHAIMQRSRIIVAKTCDVVGEYGFLATPTSSFDMDFHRLFLHTDDDNDDPHLSNVDAEIDTIPDTGDILEYFSEAGILSQTIHGDCLAPFTPLPPTTTTTTDGNQSDPTITLLNNTLTHTPIEFRLALRERVLTFLSENGITNPDERVVLYMMNHPNAPPLVLFELLAIANQLSNIESSLFHIQVILNNPIHYDSYANMWQRVFTNVGGLLNRVTHMAQRSVMMRKQLKARYSSCRIVHRFQGHYVDSDPAKNFRAYAYDDEDDQGPKFTSLGDLSTQDKLKPTLSSTMKSGRLNIWTITMICLGGAVFLSFTTVLVLICYGDNCFDINDADMGVYKQKDTTSQQRYGHATSSLLAHPHDHDNTHDHQIPPGNNHNKDGRGSSGSGSGSGNPLHTDQPHRTWESGFAGPSASSLSPQDFRPHVEPHQSTRVKSPTILPMFGTTSASPPSEITNPQDVMEPQFDALLSYPSNRQAAMSQHQPQPSQPTSPSVSDFSPLANTHPTTTAFSPPAPSPIPSPTPTPLSSTTATPGARVSYPSSPTSSLFPTPASSSSTMPVFPPPNTTRPVYPPHLPPFQPITTPHMDNDGKNTSGAGTGGINPTTSIIPPFVSQSPSALMGGGVPGAKPGHIGTTPSSTVSPGSTASSPFTSPFATKLPFSPPSSIQPSSAGNAAPPSSFPSSTGLPSFHRPIQPLPQFTALSPPSRFVPLSQQHQPPPNPHTQPKPPPSSS